MVNMYSMGSYSMGMGNIPQQIKMRHGYNNDFNRGAMPLNYATEVTPNNFNRDNSLISRLRRFLAKQFFI